MFTVHLFVRDSVYSVHSAIVTLRQRFFSPHRNIAGIVDEMYAREPVKIYLSKLEISINRSQLRHSIAHTHTHTVEPLTSLLYCQLNAAVWQNFFSSISSMVHRPFLFSSLRLDSLLSHYSIQSFRRIIFRRFLHLLPFLLPTTADCSAYSNTKLQYANAILKRTKLYRLKRSQCLREESTSSTT